MIEHIHHSRPCSENLETNINHTALHIKPHALTTHHAGTGHTSKDRDLDSHVEETREIEIGPYNDNESTNSLDNMLAFRGLEVDGHLGNLLPNSQENLTIFTWEINSLCQWVEAGEGQPAEALDHIEWELQNLSLMLRTQLVSTPAPTEPFGEVVCQYTYTLWTTQKQTNLTNSLLQDIAIFNEHDSTKLEEWLTNLETATNLTNESAAKLAKAKSRGLTHTLLKEAINSEKTWDEIQGFT